MEKINTLNIRIYYDDTDCGGVVYYANYLRYMERGRTELLRDNGVDLAKYHEGGLLFAVAEACVKYKRSARYNDMLTVKTTVKELGAATITFYTEILRDGELLVCGDVVIACVNASSGRPGRMPKELIAALK